MLLWKSDKDITINNYSSNHIDCFVEFHDGQSFHFTGFYGHPQVNQRIHTWTKLKRCFNIAPLRPWLVMGDFNEVLSNNEKIGGPIRNQHQIQPFQSTIDLCHLTPLIFEGELCTWTNKCQGAGHQLQPAFKSRFRFEKIWLQDDQCLDIIQRQWTENSPDHILRDIDNLASGISFANLRSSYGINGITSQVPTATSTTIKTQAKWIAPPSSKLKLNTDASINMSSSLIGLGALLRNSHGEIVAAMTTSIKGHLKPEEMEAMALFWSLKTLVQLELSVHLIETDSLLVVRNLKKSSTNLTPFHAILNDVHLLVSNFPRAQISHVYRSTYNETHLLAKFALTVDTECIWLEEIPPPLMTVM
uniref:RNase H type-1 domain-containing protein n=1 Tax=Cannabis sativa TaxID=3483 RepID=A0A803PSG1_CANSA